MSKREYLDRLERLLADITAEERQAAMEYYTDYLEDAGPEGERKAMEHLGSPEKVAAAVKDGLNCNGNAGNWTENGYEDGQERGYRSGEGDPWKRGYVIPRRRISRRAGWILLIIIGMTFVGVPVFATIGSVLLALAAAAGTLALGGFALALGLLIAGVILVSIGIARMFVLPGMGLAIAGGGFLTLALAMVSLAAGVWVVNKLVPGMIRGIGWIYRRMFGVRRRGR